jgi:hypothetical protein
VSRGTKYSLLFSTIFLTPSWLFSQNPQLHTKNGKRFPTVVFTSVLWTADPSYYSVAIDSMGAATYLSAPNSIEKNGVPYTVEFQVSDRTRRITFTVAQRLDFFRDNSDAPLPSSSLPSPEKSSVRTLTFTDGHLNNQFTYGTPSNPDLEELTSVFEELSETFESGRRLAYFQQYDQKAVDAELQQLNTRAERHNARELQALIPILRRLAADQRLAATTRNEAGTLLQLAQHWR